MAYFYAVVYGAEWEDILYFSDFNKAQTKLIIQTLPRNLSFHSFILEYTLDDGVFRRTKNTWSILDIEKLHHMDIDKVRANPTLAFNLIGIEK